MKTLGKLKIGKAKPLNNEELLQLRGGYDTWLCWYTTDERSFEDYFNCSGSCTPPQATEECNLIYNPVATCDCGC
jgi:hypothetical protein